MRWKTFPIELEWQEMVTPSVVHLALRRSDGELLDYKPGQFINIHLTADDGAATHRSYSIASPPAGGGSIEIAVAPVEGGLATRVLFGLKPGDKLQASGPYGRFVLRDDTPCRHILVGTGTGITPYRAMLPQLSERLSDTAFSIELLLGVQRRAEALYAQEFVEFADRHPRFRFHSCLSREEPDRTLGYECGGYVQGQFDRLSLQPEVDIVYLCGNPNMVDDAMEYLKAAGFPTKRLRREKYLPARG